MRVKVEATTVYLEDCDELVEKYPFLKDPRFKMERVPIAKKESYSRDKGWHYKNVDAVYINFGSLEDLQEFIKFVANSPKSWGGEIILSVDDNGEFTLEIYDGYRE